MSKIEISLYNFVFVTYNLLKSILIIEVNINCINANPNSVCLRVCKIEIYETKFFYEKLKKTDSESYLFE